MKSAVRGGNPFLGLPAVASRSCVYLLLSRSCLLIGVNSTSAQDWTQWRGPVARRHRSGGRHSETVAEVDQARRGRSRSAKAIPRRSSRTAASFLHSRRDPDEIVTAIDLATGKIAWQQKYTAAFTKNQYATQMAKGPNSTPLVAGNRLFTLGVTGILTAWNVADGTIAWRQDYSSSIDTSKLFCGTAMSPMLEGGSLIVQVGSDVHGGRVLALDPATGKERWSWKGLGPGYASPLAVTIDGVRQIITLTNGSIVGIDAATGALAVVDPVSRTTGTRTSSRRSGPARADRVGTAARHARLCRSRARTANGRRSKLWKNAEVTMYTASPVFADGVIYGMSNKRRGQFVALARDGWLAEVVDRRP